MGTPMKSIGHTVEIIIIWFIFKSEMLCTQSTDITENFYECKPGRCLIILNKVFDDEDLHNLSAGGINRDLDRLDEIFAETLEFKTVIKKDLKKDQILDIVQRFSGREHKGAFVFVILSHGKVVNNELNIMGTDGNPITISEIQSHFSEFNCSSLIGVPKIFLIHVFNLSLREITSVCISESDFATICVSGPHDDVHGSIFVKELLEKVETSPLDAHFSKFVEELKELSGEREWEMKCSMQQLHKYYTIFM